MILNHFHPFDVIVVDAPCSGSGLFRKDPEAIREWSLQNVKHCSLRQKRILTGILPALKPGGILIYSTCSFSECENEAISDWLIINHSLASSPIIVKKEWKVIESITAHGIGYRFYPDKVKGEGFFIAAFSKLPGPDTRSLKIKKNKIQTLNPNELNILKPFINPCLSLRFIKWKDVILAFPTGIVNDLPLLQENLYLKKAGIRVGSIIRNELIPSHELAVSTILNIDLPFIEVDRSTALQFLRRNDLNISTSMKGWVLIKYNDLTLGWIKIIPGRINNYYPKEWRILNK